MGTQKTGEVVKPTGWKILAALVCLLAWHPSPAASGTGNPAAPGPGNSASLDLRPAETLRGKADLDTALVHKLYLDGEFESAIRLLQAGLKSDPNLSHADSVFVFKHLGVMYAADYQTRERGKMYMHQLLMLEPESRIMDMYASDMINMIFQNIHDEFELKRHRSTKPGEPSGTNGNPTDSSVPEPVAGNPTGSRHLAFWIGAAVLGAGIGGFFLFLALSHSGGQSHQF